MTAAGRVQDREAPPQSVLRRIAMNATASLAAFTARPRSPASASWWPTSRLAVGALVAIAVVAATMLLLDSWAIGHRRSLPMWLVLLFAEITDFGKAEWFLVPSGVLLLVIAVIASPALGRTAYLVLASLAARTGFVFVAVAVPSLVTTIAKRLIGRARPLRVDGIDIYFAPFSWRVDFASLPSGHTTTAFAGAVALGALFPRARPVFWLYAIVIAISRVILNAHYPSDVIAGALVGACGALLVRRWFADRRLAFAIRPDGSVKPLPGPSLHRIKKVARRLAGQ